MGCALRTCCIEPRAGTTAYAMRTLRLLKRRPLQIRRKQYVATEAERKDARGIESVKSDARIAQLVGSCRQRHHQLS